jgi:hypothetical protein
MSATSVKNEFVIPTVGRSSDGFENYLGEARAVERRGLRLREMLSLAGWRIQALESIVLLVLIAAIRRIFVGDVDIPGLPHPYWIPVLLGSCQYGIRGGVIATIASSIFYFFDLSPPSAVQDFYAYSKMVSIQPALWLGTSLVIGSLRNLQIHQYTELADQFETCRRQRGDFSNGLDRAVAEIAALERRIAFDMNSVASLSRSLASIDLSDRRAAAMSFGEVFRVAASAKTFTIYLECGGEYRAALAIENDSPSSGKSAPALSLSALEAMTGRAQGGRDVVRSDLDDRRSVVFVPPLNVGAKPLAVIVSDLNTSRDRRQFDRRAEELGRLLETILRACPNQTSEARS